VETQQTVAEHNTDLPEEGRIEFRIGIDLGDVMIDGDDIPGDGVDVPAQKQAITEA
jgi:adenylate cyclase